MITITNENIYDAVNYWIIDSGEATTNYGDISVWDTSGVTDMSGLFQDTSFNDNIGGWDTGSVINMSSMFRNATLFNTSVSNWNVSNVENAGSMFMNASSFNQHIGSWYMPLNKDFSNMFNGALSITADKFISDDNTFEKINNLYFKLLILS